jgi:hypothetical protein
MDPITNSIKKAYLVAADEAYDELIFKFDRALEENHNDCRKIFNIPERSRTTQKCNFTIEFPPADLRSDGSFNGAKAISVSFPMSMWGNIEDVRMGRPKDMETMLFGSSGIIYVPELGYHYNEPLYMGTVDRLMLHLIDIAVLVSNQPMIQFGDFPPDIIQ